MSHSALARSPRMLGVAAVLGGGVWLMSTVSGALLREVESPDPTVARLTVEAILSERRDALRSQIATLTAAAPTRALQPAESRAAWERLLKAGFSGDEEAGGAFILDETGVLIAGLVNGQPANAAQLREWLPLLQGAILEAGGLAGDHRGIAYERTGAIPVGMVSDGSRLIATAAVPIAHVEGAGAPVAVAYRVLDRTQLERLGQSIGLVQLRFVSGLPAALAPALPVRGPRGSTIGHLAWDSAPPGANPSQLLLIALQLAAGAALAGFGFAIARRPRLRARLREASRISDGAGPAAGGRTGMDALVTGLRARLVDVDGQGTGVALFMIGFADASGERLADAGLSARATAMVGGLVRETDGVFDLGDGEIAVVQSGLCTLAGTRVLGRRIIERLSLDMGDVAGKAIASVGVALGPQDADSPEALVARAAAARDKAAQSGGYRIRFHDASIDAHQQSRRLLEEDLRAGILQGQLSLDFQPLLLADGDVTVGVEALARWRHPVRGPISPTEFVPLAEERGLVDLLGDWVLRQACLAGRRWPNITVAVNVSPIQFRRPGFVKRVLQIVEETGFEPWRLELEITEGVVVDNEEAAEAAMIELRAAGIRLALDDFGTGYSSLIYLRRFAFDKIKIDKSFLDSLEATGESAILVHSVIHLGRALGLTVTAEGVETVEQHRFLQAAGCHQLQGYLFSKPVPPGQIDVLLGVDGAPQAQVA